VYVNGWHPDEDDEPGQPRRLAQLVGVGRKPA
jgi:hypothetical protein